MDATDGNPGLRPAANLRCRFECWLLVAVCLAVGWFDVWTVRSSGDRWHLGLVQRDYYNLLIHGWLDGHLSMEVDVPPALLALQDPYDPMQRPSELTLHDASFYQGQYYLYFGVVPVVVLMLPFRLFTGTDLPQPAAEIVFTYGAFLVSAALWLLIRRRYFPQVGAIVSALNVLALGLAGLGPVLLRRPHVWELPIGAGYCFAMLTLLAVWQSLHAARWRAGWLAAAGLGLGLAIGSRPTYLIASPLLAAPLLWWWRDEQRVPWRETLSVAAPLAVIGGLLALHNYLRFDNPLEFGQRYQFSLDYEAKMHHFRPSYAGFNGWRYFFSAAQWSRYFPFIAPAEVPPKPDGFGGHDDVYGVLTNLPFAWLALAAPFAAWRRSRADRGRLLAWLGAAAVLFVAMTGVLLCFFGSLARYELDFTPTLMLLACVGVLAIERGLGALRWPGLRWAGRMVWGGALMFSATFAVLFSLALNRLLLEHNPTANRDVARLLNRVPAAVERLAGVRPAAWELDVHLPRGRPGETETLLSVGDPPAVDRVFVRYVDGAHVRLGWTRAGMPEVCSAPVTADFGGTHTVRVLLGAFLPPETHPWFSDVAPDAARTTTRLLRIEFGGTVLVQTYRRFDAIVGGRVRVGGQSLGDAAHPRFHGELLAVRRPALPPDHGRMEPRIDSFALRLRFPRGRAGFREPLVVAGATGQADFLGVEYLDEHRVRFTFDHWGSRLLTSVPVPVDFAAAHDIAVRLPWLAATSGRLAQRGELRVQLDGQPVWAERAVGFCSDPEEVALAQNPVGGSSCAAEFTGEVLAVERGAR